MFDEKGFFKFIYAIIFFASIFIPSIIVRSIIFIIVIILLVSKIKHVKETGEGVESVIFDIAILALIIIINICFICVTLSVRKQYASIYEQGDIQEVYEGLNQIVSIYKLDNFELFESTKNNQAKIVKGFTSYLKNELEISENDLKVDKNKINWNVDKKISIVFTVTKNDIEYELIEQ